MGIHEDLADERRHAADVLASLTPAQWRVQTLCPAWDVHGMAAHLTVPLAFSTREMVTTVLQARGNPEKASLLMAERRARRSSAELVATLRAQAGSRKAPPIVGILGPYTDVLVHQQDIVLPLGIADDRPAERWRPSLDFLVSRRARAGFIPRSLPAIRFVATDLDWSHGAGDEVRAPAAALALAVLGRRPRLDELEGPGAQVLREWAR